MVLAIFSGSLLHSASEVSKNISYRRCRMPSHTLQGHHHNGEQAARRPDMMCSICGRRFATPPFDVRGSRGWAHSMARPWVPISSLLTHMVYLLPFLPLDEAIASRAIFVIVSLEFQPNGSRYVGQNYVLRCIVKSCVGFQLVCP